MKLIAFVFLLVVMISPMMWADLGPYVFRLNAGAGYTIIDLGPALDWDWEYFEEWDQLNIKVNLQSLFFHLPSISLGAEIGYNLLYYYYVIVPYVPSSLHYEGTVAPINVSVLGSYSLNDTMSILAAAGIYIFEDGVTPGIKGAFIYKLPLAKNMAIPFSLVTEVIFGSGTPIAPGATVGFEYTFGE